MNVALRNNIVSIAKAEISYVEQSDKKGSNITKYGKWFGLDRVFWCGIFVSWVYWKAGKQLPKIGFSKGFAGCGTAYDYFVKNNMLTKTPQPGDIILFDWKGDGSWDHTGLFLGYLNNDILTLQMDTIEGNTSDHSASNGGMVLDRVRRSTQIKGYNVVFANVIGD